MTDRSDLVKRSPLSEDRSMPRSGSLVERSPRSGSLVERSPRSGSLVERSPRSGDRPTNSAPPNFVEQDLAVTIARSLKDRRILRIGLLGAAVGHGNLGDEAIFLVISSLIAKMTTSEKYSNVEVEVTFFCTGSTTNAQRYIEHLPLKINFTNIVPQIRTKHGVDLNNIENKVDWLLDSQHPIVSMIAGLDVVHSFGGGYLSSHWDWMVIDTMLPLHLAKRLDKKVLITGVTVGPFEGDRAHQFERAVISGLKVADLVDLRDGSCHEVLERYGIDYQITIDDAAGFSQIVTPLLPEPQPDPMRATGNKPYIGVVIQGWDVGAGIMDRLFGQVVDFLAFVMESTDFHVHFHGFLNSNDDDRNSTTLRSRLVSTCLTEHKIDVRDRLHQSNWHAVEPYKPYPIFQKAVYNIGTRFHMGVFSLSGGVPFYSIVLDDYYGRKHRGVQKTLRCMYDQPRHANKFSTEVSDLPICDISEVTSAGLKEFHRNVLLGKEKIDPVPALEKWSAKIDMIESAYTD